MRERFIIIIFLVSIVALVGIATHASAEYGDIVLDNKIESMKKVGVNPVVFPHWFHRIRFKCKVCHEGIFIMKAGANDINMKKIMQGNMCGKCHNGIVAFAPLECDICHSKAPVAVPIQGIIK
ncbi:MAG: c(7)-type cytochrome triheme domain-containing protein [Thermodesulfobacteriota bacterium]